MIGAIYAALVFVLALASSASAEMRGARR